MRSPERMKVSRSKATLTTLVAAGLLSSLLPLSGAAAAGRIKVGRSGPLRPGPRPRVVVAVPDSFTNPYHDFFHAGSPIYKNSKPSSVTPAVLKEFGIGKDNIITLTRTGNFAADFAKDKAQFDNIEKGQPYWFKGTNLLGV